MSVLYENRYIGKKADIKTLFFYESWKQILLFDLFFCFMFFQVLWKSTDTYAAVFLLLCLAVINLLLWNGYHVVWLMTKEAHKKSKKTIETVVQFTKEGILFQEGGSLTIPATDAKKLQELKDHYIVTAVTPDKKKFCILLRKDSFCIGQENDFKAFICKTYTRIKPGKSYAEFKKSIIFIFLCFSCTFILLLSYFLIVRKPASHLQSSPNREETSQPPSHKEAQTPFQLFLAGKRKAEDILDNEKLSWNEYLEKYSLCSPNDIEFSSICLDISDDGKDELILSVTQKSAPWMQDVYVFHQEEDNIYGWEMMSFPSDRWETCFLTNGLIRDSCLHDQEAQIDYYQYNNNGQCKLIESFTNTEVPDASPYNAPAAFWIYKL